MKEPERQLTEQHPSLIHLFTSFLRLGTTAFGGPAMIAYIRKMAVDQKHWLDEKILRVVLIETGMSLIVL
jgi:chromate transport protein ChrA